MNANNFSGILFFIKYPYELGMDARIGSFRHCNDFHTNEFTNGPKQSK